MNDVCTFDCACVKNGTFRLKLKIEKTELRSFKQSLTIYSVVIFDSFCHFLQKIRKVNTQIVIYSSYCVFSLFFFFLFFSFFFLRKRKEGA